MKGTEGPGQVSSDLEIQSTTNLHVAPREKVSEGSSPRDVQNITERAGGRVNERRSGGFLVAEWVGRMAVNPLVSRSSFLRPSVHYGVETRRVADGPDRASGEYRC